jgi:Putative prokaryotic signal transducing protein
MKGEELSTVDDLVGPASPRFCPHCDGEPAGDAMLCRECGSALRTQGYCTVCESFLHLEPGTDCPKHEIPLEDQAPRGPLVSKDARIVWVSVATYADDLRASAPRLRLESEGIPTFLDGKHMGVNTIYEVATGGVKLQVPRESLDEARVILSQTWTPPATADDLDDAWDDLAPGPWDTRRGVMKGVILFLLFWPVFFVIVSLITRLIRGQN